MFDIGGTLRMTSLLCLQWGVAALICASVEGKVECVKMLLDCGVQVNMQNEVSPVICSPL